MAVFIFDEAARTDRDNRNVSTAQFVFESQGKGSKKGFSGGIGGRERDRLKAGSRRDVDDAFLAALEHRGNQRVSQLDNGLVIETQHLDLALKRKRTEFSAKAEAGVVDQQVYRDTFAGHLFAEGSTGAWRREVSGNRYDGNRVG